MKFKNIIATHINFQPPKQDFFLPIHVGRELNEDIGFTGDNSGDNISKKNPNYCELTALYWAWKNLDFDVLGLSHYRRYFDLNSLTNKKHEVNTVSEDFISNSNFSSDKVKVLLDKSDIILPKQCTRIISIKNEYVHYHILEDFNILTNVISDLYPDYEKSWIELTKYSNKYSLYNMFIAKKGLVDDYCLWLFSILFEVEKRIKLSPYKYQQRVFGFMAERLINLYVHHNNLKISYLPVIYVDNNYSNKKRPNYKYVLDRFFKNTVFKLSSMHQSIIENK